MRDRYASLREGLVGAWIPSVSGSGLLLPDLSGHGNNGTLTNMGPEDWVAGDYGRALDFDGVDDYAIAQLSKVPPITITAWCNLKTTATNQYILQMAYVAGATTDQKIRGIVWLSSGFLRAVFQNGVAIANVDYAMTPVDWFHVAATFARSGTNETVQLFVDGQFIGDDTGSSAEINTSIVAIGAGFRENNAIIIPLDGQLDDVRVYNRALSEPEIKLLASRPGIGLRPQRRTMYYAPPTGARRRRILTSMP